MSSLLTPKRGQPWPWRKAVTLTVAAVAGLALSNGRGGTAGVAQAATGSSGTVTVHLSNRSAHDSKACKANNVTHVYVTVSDAQAHRSGKGSAGWVDLTPDLTAGPTSVQIDLLADSPGGESGETPFPTDCSLATLDQNTSGLLAGTYQQIRLKLVDNGGSPAPSPNACASLGATVFNCVELNGGTFKPLKIPSGSETGIKIPTNKISGGRLKVLPGEGLDIDIDLDACRSIVVHGGGSSGRRGGGGGGSYSLKPVLHAGEVSLNPLIAGDVMAATSSGGTVTVGSTSVASANVWLEQAPSTANYTEGDPTPTSTTEDVDNVVGTATTDASGHFVFCPVPVGNYEIVVDASTSDATITTGVSVGASGGPNNLVIPLVPGSTTAPSLNGQFTTANTTATGDTITFGGTQAYNSASPPNQAQIPFLDGSAPLSQSVTTATFVSTNCPAGVTSCPAGTNCVCFLLPMPPDNPAIGVASSSGAGYTQSTSAAAYSVFGNASEIGSPTTPECSPADLITGSEPATLPTPTLSFQTCD